MHCLSVSRSENVSQTLSKPYENPNPPDPYVSMLQESIHRFIADYRNSVTDFSNFSSIFSRLLHNIPDPPVEIVWFYSAVTFHTAKFTAKDRAGRVSAIKDLFQLLVSCSASCGALKRIAVLAPVVYELCNLVFEKEHLEGEVQSLLEGILSYFSICCNGAVTVELQDGDDDGLNSCFLDVIRVWVVDRFGVGDELKAFFPIVGDEVRKGLRMMGSGVGYLAGIVMCEAFLLNLCSKFGLEISRVELENDVRSWVVQTITGFRCFFFFDSLFRMLLEPVLPVANFLSSKDECLLQEVLYDSVMMVDYSFLKPQMGLLLGERFKNLAVTWLLVADNAIRFIRKDDNQTKVISFINACSESFLASHLIKWITNQIGMEGKIFRPNVSTPVALIKWMLSIEEQGVRVFDCEISKVRAKGVICKSRIEYMLPVTKPDGKTLNGSGDLEMIDCVDAVSMAADGMLNTTAADETRKRKGAVDGTGKQVKFVKHNFHENSLKFFSLGNDDDLSSESEVDNPISFREMEDMHQ